MNTSTRGPGRRTSRTVAAAAAVLLVAGCGGPVSKAGGDTPPIQLTVAVPAGSLGYHATFESFRRAVQEKSGGNVRLKFEFDWGGYEPGFEAQLIRDVADGEADLGLADGQGADQLGLAGFRVLDAPLVVESHAVQQQLVEDGFTDDLLADVDGLGVHGVAVFPEQFFKPVGVARAFVSSREYRGATFQLKGSTDAERVADALGFTLTTAVGPHRDELLEKGRLDGFEFTPDGYFLNDFQDRAPYVTINVNLSPWTTVLIANPNSWDDLTGEQRGWIEDAASQVVAESDTKADEAAAIERMCADGVDLAYASPGDIRALRAALEPVYASLRADPESASYLARVEEVKASTPPEAPPRSHCR